MRRLTMLAICATLVAALTAPAANARPPEDARGYWTRERIERAVPRDHAVANPQARPGGGGGGGGSTGSNWTGPELVRETTGKVFFSLPSGNYVCSGSTVEDVNTGISLVLTAGHCVHDGDGGAFATNFVYFPDYERSGRSCAVTPSPCYSASRLVTSSAWAIGGDFNYDVGFAVVAGNTLEQVQGAQAIGFGLPRRQTMYSFGYPAAGKYHGQELIYCNGTVANDPYGSLDQGMRCGMTGGSSGGPWYINFNASTGEGVANSLNSFKYSIDSRTMYGPYFGNYARAIYDAARASGPATQTVSPPAQLP